MTKGARIKALRTAARMTQDELAKRLDTTKQTIYKYENDIVTNIPLDKIEIMSSLFNVQPAYITGWIDAPPDILSSDEQELIQTYRSLDDDGKKALSTYADFLASSSAVDPASQQQVG